MQNGSDAAGLRARAAGRSIAAAFALLVFGHGASAQDAAGPTVEPGPSALACLQPAPGSQVPPPYPEEGLALHAGAVLRVQLTFVDAVSAPKAKFVYNPGGNPFSDVVLNYVDRYRLPCLAPGAHPVVAVQEFQFVFGDNRTVVASKLRDEASEQTDVACLEPLAAPIQSPRAQDTEPRTVLARMRFKQFSEPPEVTVLSDGGSRVYGGTVRRYVENYRLTPCGKIELPLSAVQVFRFVPPGTRAHVYKDFSFSQFMGAVDKLAEQHVRFDFNTMSCPFDLRLHLYQPYMANTVGEIEHSDANRREFLEWLKTISLALPDQLRNEMIGQPFTLRVPCVVLDLL